METFGADESAEIGAQGNGVLPRLVLGPAIKFGTAEMLGVALIAKRPHAGATAIVGINFGRKDRAR